MKNKEIKKGIIIYQAKNGAIEFRGDFTRETVWATQAQIVNLFSVDQSVVSRHIKNIFKDGEIEEKSNMQKMHNAKSDKPVIFYSLDVILGVGYRTNSKVAIEFRKWATKTLKQHLIEGYTVNERRLLQARDQLKELQSAVDFLQKKAKHELLAGQEQEILSLLANYSKTLTILDQYDKEKLVLSRKTKGKFILTYKDSSKIISELKKELINKKEAGDLFGQEYGDKFKGILGNLTQTFGGKELYQSLEEKAAHLLYFIIKDHPFADGNKRTGSFLFVYFLDRNNFLYRKNGEKKINDNALTALALLIAISDPKEKDKLVKIITNLLTE